ncbi:MAG: hypothetical protein GY863_08825 [bacterium]|nr:hypothetical protein [bacterium]
MNNISTGAFNPGILKQLSEKFPLSGRSSSIKDQESKFDPFDTAEKFLNLSSSDKMDFLHNFSEIDKKDFEQFVKIIRNLIRHGIVGYEYLDHKNSPYKSFITTRIGDTRLYNKKLYRNKTYPYA